MGPPSPLRGRALLDTPALNKDTAFTPEEGRACRLEGLLPPAVETLDRRLKRVPQQLDAKPNNLERYIYLMGLADRNETLFYRTLMSDPASLVPIVYGPTVANACRAFGHVYRRACGVSITRDGTHRHTKSPTQPRSPLRLGCHPLPAGLVRVHLARHRQPGPPLPQAQPLWWPIVSFLP